MCCRELAYQIAEQFRVLGKPLGLKDCMIVGGMGEIMTQAQLKKRSCLYTCSSCLNILLRKRHKLKSLRTNGVVLFFDHAYPRLYLLNLLVMVTVHRHGDPGCGALQPASCCCGNAGPTVRSHPQLQHLQHGEDQVSGEI